jgi:hypothetical protein
MSETPPQSHARQTRTLVFARWGAEPFPIVIFLITTTSSFSIRS